MQRMVLRMGWLGRRSTLPVGCAGAASGALASSSALDACCAAAEVLGPAFPASFSLAPPTGSGFLYMYTTRPGM